MKVETSDAKPRFRRWPSLVVDKRQPTDPREVEQHPLADCAIYGRGRHERMRLLLHSRALTTDQYQLSFINFQLSTFQSGHISGCVA